MRIMNGVLLGILLLSANPASAASELTAKPDTVICEGRYVMGDRDSKNDAFQFALMAAKQQAMEQTGTFLRSQTKVENYMLTEQEIESISMGLMTTEILEQRSEPVGETMAVVLKIRAIIHLQDLENSVTELKQNSAMTEELNQLRQDYSRLASQMDSLKKAQPAGSPTPMPDRRNRVQTRPGHPGRIIEPAGKIANRDEGWSELQRIETLMKIVAETGKIRPDLSRVQALSQNFLEKYPQHAIVRGYLGIAKFKNDQNEAAIADLNQAIKPQPATMKRKTQNRLSPEILKRVSKEQARFHFYLAQCYQAKGQNKLAFKHYKEAQSLDPQNKNYQQELNKR